MNEIRLTKKRSGEATPRWLASCKKCGKRAESIAFDFSQISCDKQTVTLRVSANCISCGKPLDSANVVVLYNGIAHWNVYKQHVG